MEWDVGIGIPLILKVNVTLLLRDGTQVLNDFGYGGSAYDFDFWISEVGPSCSYFQPLLRV